MKRYEGGSIFEGLHNRSKFCFAKFNLSHLNPGFSPQPVQPCWLTILLLLSGYSFSQVIEGNYKMFEVEILIRHMVKKKKDVLKVGAELAGFIFKPSTVVEAVNLKRLYVFLWQHFGECAPSFQICTLRNYFPLRQRKESCWMHQYLIFMKPSWV